VKCAHGEEEVNDNTKLLDFPKEIPLEEVPRYSSIFEKINEPKTIQFDLTKTEWIHSSFIGFLIHAKHLTASRGGKLYIIPSRQFSISLT
jgi:hypothetical protein